VWSTNKNPVPLHTSAHRLRGRRRHHHCHRCVVLVGSLNWKNEQQFRALNEKEDRTVKVIPDGREQQVNIKVSQILTAVMIL
jgi:hypothetical protein